MIVLVRILLSSTCLGATLLAQQNDSPLQRFAQVADVVDASCVECHDDQSTKGGLDLYARAAGDGVTWFRTVAAVRDRVRNGEMPPRDHDVKLSDVDRQLLVAFCVDALRAGVPALEPEDHEVMIRRLSRSEWEHTVFDLFGVWTDRSGGFPQDDLGYGFDNIGDALSFSALHLEKYLAAAEDVAEAIYHGEDPSAPTLRRVEAEAMRATNESGVSRNGDIANMLSNGELRRRVELPRAGTYRVRIFAGATQAGDEPARMVLAVDGRPVESFEVLQRELAIYEKVVQLDGGSPRIGLRFVNDYFDPKHPDPKRRDRNLLVDWCEVVGPLDARIEPEQARWLVEADSPTKAPAARLRQLLDALAPRVWRRNVAEAELQRLRLLGQQVLDDGGALHEAMRSCVQALLVSPNFLFRAERADARNADHEQAVRLSYFLWSSAPDEDLLRAARARRLRTVDEIEAEVLRMLADPRAERLATNFAAQWLELRSIDECTPDPDRFGQFDAALRSAMRRESELLFLEVLRRDLDARTLLDADFTFLNGRLARHYGASPEHTGGALGEAFVRVKLPPQARIRGGILGHASIHTITSNPTRTSPVKRGKWILDNLLGQAPPSGNESFADEAAARTPQGLREQLAAHRARSECAVCHDRMDALGLSLENFDFVGRWRDRSADGEIDAVAELPDGRRLDGLVGLKSALRDDDAFLRTLARKLFVYAVGRPAGPVESLQLDDQVLQLIAAGRVTLRDLVLLVVRSPAFRLRGGQ